MSKICINARSRFQPIAFSLAPLFMAIQPAIAQPDPVAAPGARELAGIELSLRDAVRLRLGFQGQTQAAGTPNELGIGAFVPLSAGSNSVVFLDTLANVNLPDIANSSSIVNTEVAGTTISTSTRLGYRWLNANRTWLFGVNAGYDSRPMATGQADAGALVTGARTVFYQQLTAALEAVSNDWSFNGYALIPVGTDQYQLNDTYNGGALQTYGLDVGYSMTPAVRASLGPYYQQGDDGEADGVGVRARAAYTISNGLALGANLSYDHTFATRFSVDFKVRFGASNISSSSGNIEQVISRSPVIQALSQSPGDRHVRVHDDIIDDIVAFFKPSPKPELPRVCPRLRLNIGAKTGYC